MYKSFAGMAAAAVLTMAAVPTAPAHAAPIKNAPGLAEHQAGVETVQYRYRRHYRYGVRPYAYRAYPYSYGPYSYGGYYPYASPYAYAAPYPYYRRYYRPGIGVGIGPFGFNVW